MPGILIQNIYNDEISLSGDMHLNGASIPMLNFFASPMLIEFIYGMLLYKLVSKVNLSKYSGIILFTCLSFVFICYFSNFRIGSGPLNYGIWGLAIIVGLMVFERSHDIGKSRILTVLGDISYSLYLTHVIVIYVMIYYPSYVPMYEKTSGISRFAYMVCASVTFSWLTYEYLEKPFIMIGKRIIKAVRRPLPASHSL
ncbi:acyltransferase family protein [Enterobacter sp. RHBSTW-00422]|uniref:acyltransferase family protein n=1 Tax=Enterobacter sp. RHBSTW-00422 TaxID=2742646 RepID=UPI00406C9E44